MTDKGKKKLEVDLSTFNHAEWRRVQREVAEMDCWKRQEGESFFHHRERMRVILIHAQGQLEALEEAWENETRNKGRNQIQSNLPNLTSTPATGIGSSAAIDPVPLPSSVAPRRLDLENEVVVETDPEEDSQEEHEEEVEVVIVSEDDLEGADGDVHPVADMGEKEDDSDFAMWEEEPVTPEVVELSEEGVEEVGHVEEEDAEVDDMDQDDTLYLAQIGPLNGLGEEDDFMAAAEDPEVGVSEEETDDVGSSEDGGDSGDDPDFEPSSYRERADRFDGFSI